MAGRILVVHRNELVLDVIKEMLQEIGYTVTPVVDGRRALAKAIADHFQLIIIDRNLTEDVDGVWLVERLRRYGIRTPIIGTATDGDWNVADGSVARVNQFLPAPFDSEELIGAVKSLLEKTPGRETIEDLLSDQGPELPDAPQPEAGVSETVLPELPAASGPKALPPKDARPEKPLRPAAPESELWEPPRFTPHQGPPRVLVVNSHETDRQRVGDWLRGAGYEVSVAESGHEAYELALLTDYELIVTDIWLAGPEGKEMDGFEMIEALRKSGVDKPIAVVTGYITKRMVEELLEWRVGKILLNPDDPKPLLDFVKARLPVS